MTEFLEHCIYCFISVYRNFRECLAEFVMKLRRDTDRLPVEIVVSSTQSLTLALRKIPLLIDLVESVEQERTPLLSREQACRIQSRLTLFVARKRCGNFVPMKDSEIRDEGRLPQVLTFINCFIDSCHRSRICEFGLWRRPQRSAPQSAAIRLPGCTCPTSGLFMPSHPQFSGCTRQLFSCIEKSLLDEVDDGHRS